MIRNFIQGRTEALSGSQDVEVGIGGFTLFARVSDTTNYKAQVPVQYLEDGSNASDQIIKDPITLTITGEVSDTHIRLAPVSEQLSPIDQSAREITAFLPTRTQSQISRVRNIGQSAMEAIDRADRLLNVGRNAYGALGGGVTTGKGLREQFIDFIESVYYGDQLIDVDAAYRTHRDMAITSLTITRNNEEEALFFEMTLQKLRFTKLIDVDISEFYQAPSPSAAASVSGQKDKGAQDATAGQTRSLASALLGRS